MQSSPPPEGQQPGRRPTLDFAGRVICQTCHRRNRPEALHCRACGSPLTVGGLAHPGDLVTAHGQVVGRLAGFWIRAAAYLVDVLVLLVPGVVVTLIFDTTTTSAGISQAQFVNAAIEVLYFVIGWSSFGTTVGGRVFHLFVVRSDGTMPGAWQALVREVTTLISFLMLGFGYLMIAIRYDKRSFHDLTADTYVVIRNA